MNKKNTKKPKRSQAWTIVDILTMMHHMLNHSRISAMNPLRWSMSMRSMMTTAWKERCKRGMTTKNMIMGDAGKGNSKWNVIRIS